jgi:F-type H+-transporting ATPase subunit delta
MRKAVVARRFAKALLDVTLEENSAERCVEELENLLEVFKNNPELYKVLHTPLHTAPERISLMNKVSGAVEVSEAVAGFMKVLVQTRNIKLFEEIVAVYPRLFDVVAGRLRATAESPWELGTDVLGEIKLKLDAITGKDVIVTGIKNEDLIGGLVIRMENTIIDGSIKTQLEALKEKILEGVA